MPIQDHIPVAMGEIRVSANPAEVMSIEALSSAIAVVLFDRVSNIGAMAHVLLPDSALAGVIVDDTVTGRFADLAIPAMVEAFLEAGGQKQNTTARIVGGSQLFNFGGGGTNAMNSGARNAVAIRAGLSKLGIAIEKADVGGNKGRSIQFHLSTGKIVITVAGQPDHEL